MRLYILKLEFLLKKIYNEGLINAILASVYIGGKKAALRECVDTDMALCNDDKAAPAARILDMIIRRRCNNRLHERAHAQRVADFGERSHHRLLTIQASWIAPITINSDMFSKVG